MEREALLNAVRTYYTSALGRHGCTAAGVDWPSEESQRTRFTDLLGVVGEVRDFSLIDYGCGYGALAEYLHERGTRCQCVGFDVSAEMIGAARSRHASGCGCRFEHERRLIAPADFAVASGIFNVRLDVPVDAWRAYVHDVIGDLAALSRRGFAFNALSSQVPIERRRDHLYYADGFSLAAECARRFSPRVALLHDRWAHEFTLLVRHDPSA